MTMQTLEGLGWQWRQNGVVLTARVSGQPIQVFVPLDRVWHEFHTELAAVGCPMPAAVGADISVAGLFSGIAKAAKGVAHAVTHNAVTRAASNVASTAAHYAAHAVSKVPVLGPLALSVGHLMTAPLEMAEELAKGGRIDRVALHSLKSSLADVKQIAPYATTVISLVPGVGSGLSGAIGAGLALASGQNITDALAAGVRSALPGGALAQAAFNVAQSAMQGKPIDQIALNALPIAPAQKQALTRGIALAKDLAAGKRVDRALVDQATKALPADLQKAVQIGSAIGHAKNLQGAVGALASAASLSTAYQTGLHAAAKIQSLGPHVPVPPALTKAVKHGLAAHAQVTAAVQHAQAGQPEASKLVDALAFHKMASSAPAAAFRAPAKGAGHVYRPRYHTTPAGTRSPSVGALWPAIALRTVVARAGYRPDPFGSPVAAHFLAHATNHQAHHGQHVKSFMARPASVFAQPL